MKVSVAVCTYNGIDYIEEQLVSIINQTRQPDEIIISDDCSSDGTVEVVEKILSMTCIEYRVMLHENNIGVTNNFKECILACTGDIIFTCDQDDVWNENKISIMLNVLECEDNVLVFTNAELVDANLKSLNQSLWESLEISTEKVNENLFEMLLRQNVVTGATMAFKSHLQTLVQSIPQGHLHDEWIALNAFRFGEIVAIDKKLIQYRQHNRNVVGAHSKSCREKVRRYFGTFDKVSENRKKKRLYYSMYRQMGDSELSERQQKELERCVGFWEGAAALDKKHFVNGIIWIFTNLVNQNYRYYYTGNRGAFKDVITLFIREKK